LEDLKGKNKKLKAKLKELQKSGSFHSKEAEKSKSGSLKPDFSPRETGMLPDSDEPKQAAHPDEIVINRANGCCIIL
jgi:hypothetical protein